MKAELSHKSSDYTMNVLGNTAVSMYGDISLKHSNI